MRDRKVAARYAGALLASAKADGVLEGVADSYAGFMDVAAASPDLGTFMDSPQVPVREKKELLTAVLDKNVEPVFMHFLYLLIDKNRIENFRDIGEEFAEMVEIEMGVIRAHVTTAVPLSDDLAAAMEAKLAGMTGKKIILEKETDPAVIGGACVTMGDNVLDGTVRSNLDELRKTLEQAPLR
jgi:F-type H+-transporting ATPase subunit delta